MFQKTSKVAFSVDRRGGREGTLWTCSLKIVSLLTPSLILIHIQPYRNPIYKCTGSRQGFFKWAILKKQRLKIVYIYFSDGGTYRCIAKNGNPPAISRPFHLKVLCKSKYKDNFLQSKQKYEYSYKELYIHL